ncbi:MAG: cytochrome c [Chromatiales bacterium]|nr:cytochrome c [Chromatiales bacterium]
MAGSVLADEAVERGDYLFRAAGCANCHTDADNNGPELAGGRALKTGFGTFYAPNITPDAETGIGGWMAEDFQRALRHGESPAGDAYYPAFPYPAYTQLTDTDIAGLWRYLQSVPAIRHLNRPHDLPWYLSFRFTARIWQWLFFDAGEFRPNETRDQQWNRGAYLAKAVAHCPECHTPRGRLGALDTDRWMAGTKNGPEGEAVPNITTDRDAGIGEWDEEDLTWFLESGEIPGGDYTGGLMTEVVDNGTAKLTSQDRAALANYLLSLPPIATKKSE